MKLTKQEQKIIANLRKRKEVEDWHDNGEQDWHDNGEQDWHDCKVKVPKLK